MYEITLQRDFYDDLISSDNEIRLCCNEIHVEFPNTLGYKKVTLKLSLQKFEGAKKYKVPHSPGFSDFNLSLLSDVDSGRDIETTPAFDTKLRKILNPPAQESFTFYGLLEPLEGGGDKGD